MASSTKLHSLDVTLERSQGADIEVGLSWEFKESKPKVDLDCAAVVYDKYGSLIDAAYYNNLVALGGLLKHSGDNPDGSAAEFDESILIDLDHLHADVKVIMFVVSAYSGGDLSDLSKASLKFMDASGKGEEIDSMSVKCHDKTNKWTSIVLGALYKHTPSGAWNLRTTGDATHGFNFLQCAKVLRKTVVTMLDEGMSKRRALTPDAAFNMKKGDVAALPTKIKSVCIGLGWDVPESSKLDLDASAMILGGYNKDGSRVLIETIYYKNKDSAAKGFVHHPGDNRTGAGDGDDEQIHVRVDLAPEEVEEVVFVVNVYTKNGSFADTKSAYVCLRADTDEDASDGKILAKYEISGDVETRGLVFAKLTREKDEWAFSTIGNGCGGRKAIASECLDVVLEKVPGKDLGLKSS